MRTKSTTLSLAMRRFAQNGPGTDPQYHALVKLASAPGWCRTDRLLSPSLTAMVKRELVERKVVRESKNVFSTYFRVTPRGTQWVKSFQAWLDSQPETVKASINGE